MNVRAVILGGLLFAAVALPVGAQKKDQERVYKTPRAVFDAFLAATNKRDAAAFVSCLSPDGLKDMAGGRAVAGIGLRLQAAKDEKAAKRLAGLFAVLDRHGLTEKATRGITPGRTRKEHEKASEAALELIKDPAAFLADLLVEDDKLSKGKGEKLEAKLTELKVDGDKARGIVVIKDPDRERKTPFEFVKVGDGWKLNPRPKETDTAKDKPKEKGKKDS